MTVLAFVTGAFGFGLLFNLRGKKLIVTAMIGGSGGVIFECAHLLGQSTANSLFYASVTVSLLSEVSARLLKCPVTTFLICGIIPLVPGGGMYYTMLNVVENNFDVAVKNGIETIIQACSIAIGCTLV